MHTIARANLIKDEKRKKEGKAPVDAEASWGAKGNKMVAGKGGKCRNSMIMSSRKLDRNVLFSRKVVKKRQLIRRCLNERRNFDHESEGTFPPGRDVQGEGEDNDYEGGTRDDEGKLQASPADIYQRYVNEGDKGLIHRNRGRPSNRRKAPEVKEIALPCIGSNTGILGRLWQRRSLWNGMDMRLTKRL